MPHVDVDGARLHVVARGPSFDARSGTATRTGVPGEPAGTLLLLHGLGSSAADWTHQIDAFSDRFDVIAPDFRNHGESSAGHGGSTLERLAADTVAVMDAFGVGRAHVVGLSMGGCVALQLALDHPARLDTLAIANASADMRPRGLRVRLLMALRRPLFALLGMRRIGEGQARRLFPDPEGAGAKRVSLESWNRVSKADFLAQFDVVLRWHREDRLGEIDVPVLVLGADDDFAPTAWKAALAAAVPDGRFVEIEGRHMAPLEKPASFDAALAAFVDEHVPREVRDARAAGRRTQAR